MVRLLWTGGRDSTYRLCYLLLVEKQEVQPHYVISVKRKSLIHELKAIANIKEELKKKYEVNGLLKETIFYLRDDLEENKNIEELNEKLRMNYHVGSMYGYLARYVHQMKLKNIEFCIDASPPTTIHDLVVNELTQDLTIMEKPSNPLALLFKDFRFPVIHLTKQDMKKKAEQHGFLDIMRHTWYCMQPTGTIPCGICSSCKTAILAETTCF